MHSNTCFFVSWSQYNYKSFSTSSDSKKIKYKKTFTKYKHGYHDKFYTHITSKRRDYFREMRDLRLFNENDPVQIQILRFCFISVVQNQLDTFRKMWNIHNIRAQRGINAQTGIPYVLYYIPEVTGTVDQAVVLPYDLELIEDIKNEFSVDIPKFGCNEDFVQLVELLTGYNRDDITLPQTVHQSRELFIALKNSINSI